MKRRGVLLLASVVVMVVVGAGVALAANITCTGGNCLGTNQSDNITGTAQVDIITAASGGDTVNARGSDDEAYGDRGNDTVNGGGGSDYGEGGRGTNVVNGQGGSGDVSNVVDGDGNDVATGGDGDDDVCIVDFESADVFGTGENDAGESCEDVFITIGPF